MAPGRVSVVVIPRDRAAEAARTAALLTKLPEHPAVIVVDNGSTDGTPERVRALAPDAVVLEAGRNHGAAARNAGADHEAGGASRLCRGRPRPPPPLPAARPPAPAVQAH